MKTTYRVILELFGPCFLGGLISVGVVIYDTGSIDGSNDFLAVIMFVLFSYMIFGIPSIFYTLIMEYCFWRGLKKASLEMVALSTILGYLAASSPILLDDHPTIAQTYFPGVIGAAVGLLISAIILISELTKRRRNEDQKEIQTTNLPNS